MSQILELLFSLAFTLMALSAAINAATVRLLKARGTSLKEAFKQATTTRWFWIELICSVLSLAQLLLTRLQRDSLIDGIVMSIAVIFFVTGVSILVGLWVIGMWLEEKKRKASSSKRSEDTEKAP